MDVFETELAVDKRLMVFILSGSKMDGSKSDQNLLITLTQILISMDVIGYYGHLQTLRLMKVITCKHARMFIV